MVIVFLSKGVNHADKIQNIRTMDTFIYNIALLVNIDTDAPSNDRPEVPKA